MPFVFALYAVAAAAVKSAKRGLSHAHATAESFDCGGHRKQASRLHLAQTCVRFMFRGKKGRAGECVIGAWAGQVRADAPWMLTKRAGAWAFAGRLSAARHKLISLIWMGFSEGYTVFKLLMTDANLISHFPQAIAVYLIMYFYHFCCSHLY